MGDIPEMHFVTSRHFPFAHKVKDMGAVVEVVTVLEGVEITAEDLKVVTDHNPSTGHWALLISV